MKVATTALERVAIALASLALSLGLIALLSGFFAGRDPAGVSAGAAPLGQRFPDQGHVHLHPGQPRTAYDSNPPTSGPHVPEPVVGQGAGLNDDQLLQALEAGNVVIAYGTAQPPSDLVDLARQLGPFTPRLASAGQAVILMRRPGTVGLIGLAWTRMLRVSSPRDPLLRAFAGQWLGHGAPGR